jgi:hypothetical protein
MKKNQMKQPHQIGGSLLPSSEPRLMVPIESSFGKLQVHADIDADTHRLTLDGKEIAAHPNGYSVHNLAERIVKGDMERVRQQAEYIVACGGTADITIIKPTAP